MFIKNIDSLFFSIDIKEFEENNINLIEKLNEYKTKAKENSLEQIFIELGSKNQYKFQILPNGLRFHAFILHNDSLSISISEHRSKNKTNYPLSIRIKSLMLWEHGYIIAYMKTIEILKDIFQGEFIAEKISRADLCCHIDNFTIDPIKIGNFIGNFRKNELFFTNRKITGITFGTFKEKNVMLRIYDKSLEIKTSGKTWFNDIWLQHNLNIEKVWNVEFQVGRTFFKEHNIETIQDLILKTRPIWEYLTTEYCRMIIYDDINTSRCTTDLVWNEIQHAFDDSVKGNIIKRDKQLSCRAEELIPLLAGVFTSYGACKFNLDINDVFEDFKKDFEKYLYEKKDNKPASMVLYEKMKLMYS